MARIVIGIGGMSCQGCVKNVTGVLRDLTGVESVEVSLDAGQASIDYDPAIMHAAHERIVYERLKAAQAGKWVSAVQYRRAGQQINRFQFPRRRE